MYFVVEKHDLVKVLARVTSATERRNTVPILGNVLFRVSADGSVGVIGTDLDILMSETIKCLDVEAGQATAPAHLLYDAVRKFPEGAQVKCSLMPNGVFEVSAGRAKLHFPSLPPEDFPKIAIGNGTTFDMSPVDLLEIIRVTSPSMSTEETRYYLNGAFIHAFDDKTMRGVATDGHRLSLKSVALPDGAASIPGVIIPRKTLALIPKFVDGSDPVTVTLTATKIMIERGNVSLISKLIDGSFPDYARVIPTPDRANRVMKCDRKGFLAALELAMTVSDKVRAVKLSISNNRCVVSMVGDDTCASEEMLDAEYSGTDMVIGFNPKYLAGTLSIFSSKVFTMRFEDGGGPAVFTCADENTIETVVMPMRV